MAKQKEIQGPIRLDKWLWCARFFKTRASATDAVKSGKVQCNGKKLKPSHIVKAGEQLSIRRGPYTWDITVIELVNNRKSAADAGLLYRETAESLARRGEVELQIKAEGVMVARGRGRPTKRERRDLLKLRKGTASS